MKVSYFEHGYCQTKIKEVQYLHSAVWVYFTSEKVKRGDYAVTMKTAFRLSTPGSKFQPAGLGTLPFPDILNPNMFLHN